MLWRNFLIKIIKNKNWNDNEPIKSVEEKEKFLT